MTKNIDLLLHYFEENPNELVYGFEDEKDFHLKIVYVDTRKRCTEFYRVQASYKKDGKLLKQYYWFRVVKNKPKDQIREVLSRQFEIMSRVYGYFGTISDDPIKMNCCQPISLLTYHNAVITKECSGILFNKYLQIHMPLFYRDQIIRHFKNCGIWLRHFHKLYRYDKGCNAEYDIILDRFRSQFNRSPLESLDYLTLCHNDYSPRNIFVSDNSIEVIDFVGSDIGFPEQDIEFFKNYIQKAKFNMMYSFKFKQKLISSFESGYKNYEIYK